VVDRQASPGAETSFANGGQISVSHAEPWANPGAPLKVLAMAGQGRRAAAVSHAGRHARSGCGACSSCANARQRAPGTTSSKIVRLGTYSRAVLQQLRRDTGLQYDQRTQGILHFYTSPKSSTQRWNPPSRCVPWAASAR
jgi:D-amino-acid dehydrogenase